VVRHNYSLTTSLARLGYSIYRINGFLQYRSILLSETLRRGPGPRSNETYDCLRDSRESHQSSRSLDRCGYWDFASSLFSPSQQSVKHRSDRRSNAIENEQHDAVSSSHCFVTLGITDGHPRAASNPVKIAVIDNSSSIDTRTPTMRPGYPDGRHLKYSVCSPSCRSLKARTSTRTMTPLQSDRIEATTARCSINFHHYGHCDSDFDHPGGPGLAVDISDSTRKL
jgi:hypothetical protein